MKNKLNGLFLSVFAFAFLVAGCSTSLDERDSYLSEVDSSDVGEESVTLKLGFNSSSRSALPEVSLSEISYITLYYQDTDIEDEFEGFKNLGFWESVEEMNKAVISFKTGSYEFTLTAMSDSVIYADQKTYTIKNGENSLSFTPRMEVFNNENPTGKGNLNVSIRYDDENVVLVTAGLYTLEGAKVSGYGDESVEIKSGGQSIYNKTDVPSGNYLLIFRFYADAEKKMPLGTYREYCSIVNNKTSSSECVLESIASLFSVSYNLNGGVFANDFTAPGSFTRKTDTILLPANTESQTVITKTNCTFDGWYENSDFSGSKVTEIASGSTGNKTYYAHWLENATITFNSNASGATINTTTQSVIKNVETALKTASDLGLSNTSGNFLGWALKSDAAKAEYSDGGAITVSGNTVLYAIWTVTKIKPSSATDTTDSDGDGISDWDEIHKYYTDPSSPDTDGDGWTDKEELSLYSTGDNSFNPLIADTPSLGIKITGKPAISYVYTLSDGGSDTVSVSENNGTVGSQSTTNSNTKTHNETHGWSLGFKESYSFVKDKTGWTVESSQGYNGSVSNGDSYTYSQSASEGWSKSWSNGKSSTNTHNKTVTGGKLRVPVKFVNPSNIAYTVQSVTVALYRLPTNSQEGRTFVIDLAMENSKTFTISPNSESGQFYFGTPLGIDATEQLMKFSSGFEVEVSGYKITLQRSGARENDFTEALTEVKAKTASVYIDWGNGSGITPKTYNVSVKNNYNTEATTIDDLYQAPSLGDIFQNILHYTKGTDYTLNNNGQLQKIYGIENADSNAEGAWFICHQFNKNNGTRYAKLYAPNVKSDGEDWTLDGITLNSGDEVYVIYSVDNDGDGVPLNEELIYGTSDTDTDSDDDGLTDYEEIYGWYKSGIGLEAKYSSENKVYSNPMLKDTDGDDLLDYSENSSEQDSDPIIPKMKDDTSLSVYKYTTSSGGTFKDATYNSSTGGFTISDTCNEYVYLDFQPKVSFATVKYSFTSGGAYQDFDSATKIPLKIGTNKIYILCTAPDGTTTKEYPVEVTSSFISMNNFKVNNEKYTGGNVRLTWDSYGDVRATEAYDGGYILYGKKGTVSKTLTRADVSAATDTISDFTKKDEFFLKLTKSNLSSGLYKLNLSSNTNYTLSLFAYAHSTNDSTFKSTALGSKQFKSATTQKATLKFYAHFVKGTNEHDSGSEGEYYWSVSDSSNYLGLNDLSKGSSSSTVNLEDGWCYGFNGDVQHSEPSRFGSCTKEFSHEFDRRSNYSFTVYWEAKEDDPCNTDNIGKVTATFSYSVPSDTWTCSWSAGGGDGCGSSGSGSYSVTAGKKSSGNHWDLHNSDKGEIELHWDWSWDE